jgi:MFS family permease
MNSITNEIRRLLAFPLQHQAARKNLLFGILITLGNLLVPILPALFLYGYIARIIRKVVEDNEFEMPEWQDWGGLLKEGVRLLGTILIYELPLLLLFMLSYLFILIPSLLIIPMTDSEANSTLILFLLFGEILFFISLAVIMLLSAVYAALLPAMMVHVAVKQEFKAAFRVNEWFKIFRTNLGGFLAALIVMLGVGSLLYFAFYGLYFSIVFCCLTPILGAAIGFYMMVVSAAAIGDAYRTGMQKLANAPANA